METSYDVLISGAGPVGLWLACELKLAGVNVAILDRRSARTTESRALAIHGRTMEVFGLRGLEGDFLAEGRKIPMMEYGALDTRIRGHAVHHDSRAHQSALPIPGGLPEPPRQAPHPASSQAHHDREAEAVRLHRALY